MALKQAARGKHSGKGDDGVFNDPLKLFVE